MHSFLRTFFWENLPSPAQKKTPPRNHGWCKGWNHIFGTIERGCLLWMGDRITTEEQTATNYVSSVVQKLSNRHGFLGNCPKDMRKVMIAQMEWVFSNRQPLFFVLWVIGVSSGLMLGGSCSWFDGKGVSSILMPAPQLNQLHLPPTKLLSETLYFETTSIDPDSLVPWFLKPLAITGLAHMSRTGCHSQSSTRTLIYKFFLDKMTLVYGRYICM